MKLKIKFAVALLAVACSGLLGCSRNPSANVYKEVANTYYRLGAADAQMVIFQHQINGTPVPTGSQLVAEAKEYDRTHGGDKDTLLQSP